MTFLRFTVPGRPIPKGRPRFAHGHAFTPLRTREYERRVATAAADAMGERLPTQLPVSVTVEAVFPPPKVSRKRQAEMAEGELPFIGTVDVDNLMKAALDGINGLVYLDDRQVYEISACKRYGWEACLNVTVETYGGD